MKIRIGIITALKSLSAIQAVDQQMRQECDITYLPYSTTMELANIYLDNISKFDGILFSGILPYSYVSENVARITKPAKYLYVSDIDYYRIIAKLYTDNPNIDFRRVSFDNESLTKKPSSTITVLDDIFDDNNYPFLNEFSFNLYSSSIYDEFFENYRKLWQSKKVDLIVTQLTNIADRLKSENIPHVLLRPCSASILSKFNELVNDIKDAKFKSSLAACCTVQIAHENPTEEEYAQLHTALEDFNSRQNMCFVIRRNGDVFDLVTSGTAAKELTNGYISCFVTSFLLNTLSFHTFIGWGIDFDVVNAHQKAVTAIRESQKDPHRYTYMVNEQDEIIGPFGGERTIVYQMKPSARINNIAKKLGISPLNLEKLTSLQKKKNITEFSASDLVFYLDITPRSATRILKKLVECGVATKVDSVNLSGRGRPSAIYKINLDNIK